VKGERKIMKLVKKQSWASLILVFLVSMTIVTMLPIVKVASANSETYIFVDPPEVRDILPGDPYPYFAINISVADAPDTYTWEIYLSWNPTLLNVIYIEEGDFLHRWMYTTTFIYVPTSLDDANIDGEIMIGCSLKFDPPWANGTGWLCTLWFQVMATGSTVLNLFDTRLWDYEWAGSAFYTYHPNVDGFFFNTLFHDVDINSVTASPTVVEVNESVTINVTVTNEGNYTETSGTFNVTVYADMNAYNYTYDINTGQLIRTTIDVGNEEIVGTQTVSGPLAPGATTTLTFTWNTIGVARDKYTISAEVKGDDDTRNNLFIDDTVRVIIMGDTNGDGKVDVSDLFNLGKAYGSSPGDSNWDEDCDFNGDGKVDGSDLIDLDENYGRSV